jgi:hypothetical protein
MEFAIISCIGKLCKWRKLKIISHANEAPRRKRSRYQSGLKSILYLGGHVVSPQTPLPRAYPTASGWGIQKFIIKGHDHASNFFPKSEKKGLTCHIVAL